MRHKVCIRVLDKPGSGGVVACRTVSLREKLLTLLLGPKQKVMVLVPGNSVESIAITELPNGGAVHEYLDTLLPTDWDGMDVFERRNYLSGSDFGEIKKPGTVKRTQVSNMEIWCECFGKERANIRRTDSNELTAILARLGWKRLDSKVRIPLYGPQYVFVPKECSQ